MSTAIVVRFYFDRSRPAADHVLGRMARTLADWPQASGRFGGVKVSTGDRHTSAVPPGGEGDLDADGVGGAVAGHGGPSRMLSTTSSFRCWRFARGAPAAGSVPVTLEAWGDDWTIRHHEEPLIGGEAALWVGDVGPFCALVDEGERARRPDINPRVEENLDALTGLLFRLIEALEPRSLKVFSDAGLYLPFNAHLLYLREESAVRDDLALIDRVWRGGLPGHNIAPLGGSPPPDDLVAALHPWRTPEQRERLRARIESSLPLRLSQSPADVRQKLASGDYDTFAMPVGTTVLEFPHFMNAFLDRFYLDAPPPSSAA